MFKFVRPFVLITGMHRSGTSFLARSLNLKGVYLGKLDSIITHEWSPHKSNRRGHWENQNFLTLADKTLAYNHGKWYEPPIKIKINKEIGKRIKKCVEELQGNSLLASGFKDPRFVLCFDSWLPFLPRNFVLVGIFRHPLKVAESLKLRSKFSYKHSLELWKIYNEKLLDILEKHDGFLLNFDWNKKKLLDQINLVSKKIGLAESIDLSEWYTKRLIKSGESFQKDYSLSDEIKSIYSKLKEKSENNNKVQIKYYIKPYEMPSIINRLLNEIQFQGKYFNKLSSKN